MDWEVLEYLRLAGATVLVFLPGWLVARALGQRGGATMLAWAMAAVFVAWAAVFVVHGTIWLALGILATIAVVAAWLVGRRSKPLVSAGPHGRGLVFIFGLVLGAMLWPVAGVVTGDGFFHEARIRKLVDLGNLHLRSVDEFKSGGLHPGYAFPLWHGFDALVAKLSGLDPAVVLSRESSLLVPLACLVAWEAGVAVFGSAGGGVAVLAGQLGLYLFAAGHGGSFALLAQPPSAVMLLFLPAVIALFFGYVGSGRLSLVFALAAAFGAAELINAPYGVFALIPFVAYAALRRAEWRTSAIALAAACVPILLVELWTLPLVSEWRAYNPSSADLASWLRHYAGELRVWSPHHFRIEPGLVGRSGAVSVAALALVPLAGLAARRRWSAFVLGGTVSLLLLLLVPTLFVRFTDLFSLSSSRRAAGFIPLAFAFAGGLLLLARSALVLPAALAAGIALELRWPGDFAYGLRHGGPAIVTWFALVGGALSAIAAFAFRRRKLLEQPGRAALAACLFVLPIALHGLIRWSPLHPTDPGALSPKVERELRALPPRAVVIASPELSYRIAAAAPVYIVAAPVAHVADTNANRPFERVRAVKHWLAVGDPAIPGRYGATWALAHGRLYPLTDPLPVRTDAG
jgi:hypothetical protein